MEPSQSTARLRSSARNAANILASADYELACAASVLEKAGHPAAAEAEALFQAALAFRQKIEAEING